MPLAQSADTAGVLQLANMPFLWVLAMAVFAVIIIQSTIYMMAVRRNVAAADMTKKEANTAFRAGAVSAIGPSLAVVLVSIAILPLFGTPPVLVRIGLIGSAATEVAEATAAAGTMGAGLGGEGWNADVFTVALFAMSLSGAGWMLATLILTPILSKGSDKVAKVNPALMAIIPSAALLAAFATLTMQELPKSGVHLLAVAVSAIVMSICLLIAKKFEVAWLREWALGFSIMAALIAAGIATA
ncbi:DUF5058 family protein [Brevibacterium moorei]|uniref:DUF5058 family protein n=1 Tax=Brevibacterium moorei TaxID=2968457 RepID=UPI00211BD0F9|nr:DUF5058 family protein [Brevibacterium sp. 68QC2CO]MCQ9386891.1 DUF5058 family protein [Brevibacterium sp. 68QC2CO]